MGILLDFGDDEKNWAILFVALEVEGERFRVEGAMLGTAAGVVAVEDEKIFGFRGIRYRVSCWARFFPSSEANL